MTMIASARQIHAAVAARKATGRDPSSYLYTLKECDWSYRNNQRLEQLSTSEIVRRIKRRITTGQFIGKWLRPWEIINPASRLPCDKVWVGFEYETGYDRKDDFLASLRWVDKKFRNACYDCEGTGCYPVEYTFFPVELDHLEFKSGPAAMIYKSRELRPVHHEPNRCVGTHVNISTPTSRNGFNALRNHAIQYVCGMLSSSERKILFGRASVYGNGYPNWMDKYWEFKFFNTTYDMRVWLGYCLVVRKYVDFIQRIEQGFVLSADTMCAELRALIPKIRKLHKKPEDYRMKSVPAKYRKPVCASQS